MRVPAALAGLLHRRHVHRWREDWLEPGRLACRCGARPLHETTLRRALQAEAARISTNGAPAATGTPPNTTAVKEPTMTRSISRRAHDVHAGDIILRDPDHDRPVRWRVTRPAEVTADGVAIIDYVDLPSASAGIAYFGGLVELTVEPVGGAA